MAFLTNHIGYATIHVLTPLPPWRTKEEVPGPGWRLGGHPRPAPVLGKDLPGRQGIQTPLSRAVDQTCPGVEKAVRAGRVPAAVSVVRRARGGGEAPPGRGHGIRLGGEKGWNTVPFHHLPGTHHEDGPGPQAGPQRLHQIHNRKISVKLRSGDVLG